MHMAALEGQPSTVWDAAKSVEVTAGWQGAVHRINVINQERMKTAASALLLPTKNI